MNRQTALRSIDNLMQTKCEGCKTKAILSQQHGNAYSHIDGFCAKACPVGRQLQELGKHLTVRKRKALQEDEAA